MIPDKHGTYQIDPNEYSREYFLTACDGFETFKECQGINLPPRLKAIWNLLDTKPGMKLLDLGCGRGEIIIQCGLNQIHGVGLDYSKDAIALANKSVQQIINLPKVNVIKPDLLLADIKQLPFLNNSFECVLMSDLVEHLNPNELNLGLNEVWRVLSSGGRLLIHTMPNLWYYQFGYPLFRLVRKINGENLPRDPRKRHQFPHVHINEQTPRSLRKALNRIGFKRITVWLFDYHDYHQHSRVMKRMMRLFARSPLIKYIFNNDIFAIAEK